MQGDSRHKPETHLVHRIGWLRAAVLGANDGIISTASLIVGVASASGSLKEIIVAGSAGVVAGAMSMAAGEYVSVSSQADTEQADLTKERLELQTQPEFEKRELATIYQERGLDADLALKVAEQLMAKDALAAHARDELNISDLTQARPVQAALTSAATFTFGGLVPLSLCFLFQPNQLSSLISLVSLLLLGVLGGIGAWAGGAPIVKAAWRVIFWGAFAMGATALIGKLFGHTPIG